MNRTYRPLSPLQHVIAVVCRAATRVIENLPVERWLRRRLRSGIEVTRHDVRLGRAGPGLDGLTVAYLSDFHAGTLMNESDLRMIFEEVAGLEPDLVCLGGDFVENFPEEAELFRRPLGLLRPPLGVIAVPGNHEYHGEEIFRSTCEVLREAGVRVLLNEGLAVTRNGSRLWVAGVEDARACATDVPAALEGRQPGDPVLFLAHRPDTFLDIAPTGADLTLSGHTHGGQIAILGWTPFRHTSYGWWRGWYEQDGARLYVGRGIGTTTLPFRFGARPEIAVFRLRATGLEIER